MKRCIYEDEVLEFVELPSSRITGKLYEDTFSRTIATSQRT